MRICAKCFKAEDWKEKFKLIAGKKIDRCFSCGQERETVDVDVFLPYLSSVLFLFEKKDDGHTLTKVVEEDFDLFSTEECSIKILEYALACGEYEFDIKDSVGYKSNFLHKKNSWENLKTKIKNQFRFFISFDPTEEEWDKYFLPEENGTIIKKGAIFFRGRLNDKEEKLLKRKKDLDMPPAELTPAGRVNPHGIPCLYLTQQEDTVAYELRATYGDKVSIGRFVVQKDLRVIDFENKFLVIDAIENGFIERDFEIFLLKKQIGNDLSRPMRRYDNKEIEYVPTQFICEYIKTMGADGIMFDSAVHKGGKNLVLFKSDKVKCTKVLVRTVGKTSLSYQR